MTFRSIYKAGVSIVIAIGLAGCATAAQREAKSIGEALAAAKGQMNACAGSVNSDPAYVDLSRHIPLSNPQQATISQLTDPSFATQHEVDLLSERHDRLVLCRKAYTDNLMVAPPLSMVASEAYAKSDENVTALVKKQINWGEFVTRQKAVFEDTENNWIATTQRIKNGLEARHQQELAQRAAAAQAFSNAMYQQQILNQNQQVINNMNRPVMTNCNRFGNSVNCTSY